MATNYKITSHLQLTFLVLIQLISLSNCTKLKSCKTLDFCSASTDQGKINLWALSNDNGRARFQNVWDKETSKYFYSWNPCKSWVYKPTGNRNQTNMCKEDTSVCATWNVGFSAYHSNIGKSSSAKFVLDQDTGICSLVYDGIFRFQSSVVQVELYCSSGQDSLETFTRSNLTNNGVHFKTRLHSKYACPVQISSGLSVGSILCIIFFSSLGLYLIGGILWTKFSRGATGVEMIPHFTFWKDFFTLVQDGAMFTVFKIGSLCSGGSSAGYESI